MKLSIDDVPLCKLHSLVKKQITRKGFIFLVGAIILPINLAVAEPAAQPKGLETLAQMSSNISTTVLYKKPVEKMIVTATAFSSSVDETDSTPCIAARGYDLCEANKENVVAANFVPIGTKLLINGEIITVVDRMNSRYSSVCSGLDCRVDFWKKSKKEARKFGKKTIEIQILSRPE